MSCTDNTCGTGGWGGPQPGDPDNNITLTATSAYGGIDVNWTYPTTNAFAVAYAIVYRNLWPDFATAIEIGKDTDGLYFDRVGPGQLYYYWIEVVSINGTHGTPIGPASASAKATVEQTIRDITGKIDAGVLAQALKTEIGRIPVIDSKIYQEMQARVAAQLLLTGALDDLGEQFQGALTLLNEEVVQRTEGQNALVSSLSQMGTLVNQNFAAIQTEQQVRSGADSALAQRIDTVMAAVGADTTAAIQVETNARVAADSALAQQITTAQSALNGDIASAEQRMETKVNTVDGKVTSIGALYTAKVTVNNLIGGFGIYNNGYSVEAGFDVDTFWVGRTSNDKVKPFIVVGETTYINEAVINQLTFSKLRADDGSVIVENGKLKAQFLQVNHAQSSTFIPNQAGWMLGEDGYAEFNNVKVRGDIEATTVRADSITANHLQGGAVGRELVYFNENGVAITSSYVWMEVVSVVFTSSGLRPLQGQVTFASRQTAGQNGAEQRVRIRRNFNGQDSYLYGGPGGTPVTTTYDGSTDSLSFIDAYPVPEAVTYVAEIQLLFSDDRASFSNRTLFLRELNKTTADVIIVPYTGGSVGGGGGGGGGGGPYEAIP